MAMELAKDPYVPTIGTLPAGATREGALAWVERQQQHHVRGTGFAFSIADADTNRSLGLGVELYIEPWNTASVRTAEKAGFVREGILRSHQEIDGMRRDMLLCSAVRQAAQ